MRRAAVVRAGDLPMLPLRSGGVFREPIGAATGCRQLVQRVTEVHAGDRTAQARSAASEEVVFVCAGTGTAIVAGRAFPLEPGTALFVPPGAAHRYEAGGDGLSLVSVIAPPPGAAGPGRAEPATPRPDRGGSATGGAVAEVGAVTVHERDQPSLPAGDDRTFRLLIDPRSGCRNVTQFLGTIRRSRAPAHTHTYEEVIYILAGAGIVHVDDRAVPIEAGCSVFLPPGVPHCLENVAAEPLRLLGVFSPAGSPADKREG